MSRKRGKARLRGPKGRPTPKNTPGEMTRGRHNLLRARRSEEALTAASSVDRALETIRAADRGEKAALELLVREAGGVLLDPKEK